MTIKLFGALLVILSCGGIGFHVAFAQKRQEKLLKQLIQILDFFTNELQYHRSPLPELCKHASAECNGMLSRVFLALSNELCMQVFPNVEICMNKILAEIVDIPKEIHNILQTLGKCLGRFDLNGQLKDLDAIRFTCNEQLGNLQQNRDVRLRTYQTLGLCAGAALVILFI